MYATLPPSQNLEQYISISSSTAIHSQTDIVDHCIICANTINMKNSLSNNEMPFFLFFPPFFLFFFVLYILQILLENKDILLRRPTQTFWLIVLLVSDRMNFIGQSFVSYNEASVDEKDINFQRSSNEQMEPTFRTLDTISWHFAYSSSVSSELCSHTHS